MKELSASEIRTAFIDFFAERGHRQVRSHALIPPDDPTLYFVNAGMVQFKDIFVGARTVDYDRAVSAQKCLRASGKHNDLENVGRTPRHHTFFEMLGNFSFGAYFKTGAIDLGWEFLTAVLELPADKLHVTTHPEDSEAEAYWRDQIGIPPERLHHDPDNFWSMGDTGPCGPCSEIHFDLGVVMSDGEDVPFGHPRAESRYMEIWNLVFMQYDRSKDGTLTPLPKPSIDTGAGLERLALVCQSKLSNYDTDLFVPIIARVAEASGHAYGRSDVETDVAMRVIADHSRASAFLIADGIYPDNLGRGYVLRRIMRRAIRFGLLLGFEGPFLVDTTAHVVELMSDVYPELMEAADTIRRVVLEEEIRFGRTIRQGNKRLAEELGRLAEADGTTLDGRVAFELYDTYGFPKDLTELICSEAGVEVDSASFDEAMEEQRERARASSTKFLVSDTKAYGELVEQGVTTSFVGYETETAASGILALLAEGTRVPRAAAGQRIEIVCGTTPFYAEAGGQVGDVGELRVVGGDTVVQIEDTQKPYGDLIVHLGTVLQGSLSDGDNVELEVDHVARNSTRKNHSATHLLHYALRAVLGDHVRQRGSMVGPERLRFDFSHTAGMTREEITQVEELVNALILANDPVSTEELSMDDAMAAGAIAFFEEKYGDAVRMLRVGPQSTELCGGTHAGATGDIGLFKLVSESAISSGVRRVEGVTGMGALRWVQQQNAVLRSVAEQLNTSAEQVADRVGKLLVERKAMNTALDEARLRAQLANAASSLDDARTVGDYKVAVVRLDGVPGKELRPLGETLRDKLGSGVVLLLGQAEGKVSMIVAATKDIAKRVHAGKIVGELAPLVGGRGGGRPDLAQAGGTDASQLDRVVETFYAAATVKLQ